MWLSDPIWTFVSVLVSIAVAAIPLIIFFLTRPKKSLSADLTLDVPIVTVVPWLADRLEVELHGRLIKNARTMLLKVRNNGTIALHSSDYTSPLSFNFGPKAEFQFCRLLHASPSDLDVNIIATGGSVIITISCFNPREYFYLSICVCNAEDKISFHGRVAGLTLNALQNRFRIRQRRAANSVIGLIIMFAYSAGITAATAKSGNDILMTVLFTAGALFYWYILIRRLVILSPPPRPLRKRSLNITAENVIQSFP